jgi:tRNA(fMet)-specific endonuclease VapC
VIAFLLDTNICIYIIKQNQPSVFERFKSLSLGSVGISAITAAELQFGINKSLWPEKNRAALEQFLIPLEIIDFDYEAAIHYGELRSTLEKSGKPIGPLDMLIGAHARSLNVTLVTNNLKEFVRIPGLKLENWAAT